MAALSRSLRAWDGLELGILEWGREADHDRLPVLCLPGLVRSSEDFADFAERHAQRRRIVAIDYPGRGHSGRARNTARYGPEACLRDVLDVAAALHLHRVVAVGTSFGGLLAMGIGSVRPGMLAAMVLNDIGPEIGAAGSTFLRRFIAEDPALPNIATAAAHLRRLLPYLSLQTEDEWQRFATLTYAAGPDGMLHPRWDTRIADLLAPPVRDLWPMFRAVPPLPMLLVLGLRSNILLSDTVLKMRGIRPDLVVAEIEGVGHAPTLAEPVAQAAIDAFLAAVT